MRWFLLNVPGGFFVVKLSMAIPESVLVDGVDTSVTGSSVIAEDVADDEGLTWLMSSAVRDGSWFCKASQSINQSINRRSNGISINQSINQSTEQGDAVPHLHGKIEKTYFTLSTMVPACLNSRSWRLNDPLAPRAILDRGGQSRITSSGSSSAERFTRTTNGPEIPRIFAIPSSIWKSKRNTIQLHVWGFFHRSTRKKRSKCPWRNLVKENP